MEELVGYLCVLGLLTVVFLPSDILLLIFISPVYVPYLAWVAWREQVAEERENRERDKWRERVMFTTDFEWLDERG